MKLNYLKSINENVNEIYKEIKHMKHKIDGAELAIAELEEKYEKRKKEVAVIREKKRKMLASKKYWFQKFRWFVTRSGGIAVGGKDATTNEILIKKHVEKDDIIFHTEMPGSPFVVVKKKFELPKEFQDDLKPVPGDFRDDIEDAAVFTASFSRGWKNGITDLDVYWVLPDQVSKTLPSGEYAGKGSFMIYGKKNEINASLELAISKFGSTLMIAPIAVIEHYCRLNNVGEYFTLFPSSSGLKVSQIANKLSRYWKIEQNEVLQILPSGTSILSRKEVKNA